MVFYTKCGILLVLCTIKYKMKQCVAEDNAVIQNDDLDLENSIKDALLLIELLKRDKAILREDAPVDESTCAPTTLETITPDHNGKGSSINLESTTQAIQLSIPESGLPSSPNQQPLQHRRSFMSKGDIIPLHYNRHDPHPHIYDDAPNEPQANFFRPRGFFRRRFPDYFYFQNYFDFPREVQRKPIPGFRRFQKNDEIETPSATPGTSTSTTAAPLTTITKIITQTKPVTVPVTTRTSAGTTKKIMQKQYRRAGNLTTTNSTTTAAPVSTNVNTTSTTVTSTTDSDSEKENTRDPVRDEIDYELHKELKGNLNVNKNKLKSFHTITPKVRTTLRIFLGGSTRYNIPFPANHAFCYTNPESSLCRVP